jgi:hypothetical protein
VFIHSTGRPTDQRPVDICGDLAMVKHSVAFSLTSLGKQRQ